MKLLTEAGAVELDVPRDRAGTHEPMIVPKGQRRLDGIDRIVIGLYAHGMTVRDIQTHLADIYEIDVSPDLVSKITDAVLEEVREWQQRPLEPGWFLLNVANLERKDSQCRVGHGTRRRRRLSVATSS